MQRCWHTEPKLRPSFESLRVSLENLLRGLSPVTEQPQPFYMNLRKGEGASECNTVCSTACWEVEQSGGNMDVPAVVGTSDYRYVTAPLSLLEDAAYNLAGGMESHPHDGQPEDQVVIHL